MSLLQKILYGQGYKNNKCFYKRQLQQGIGAFLFYSWTNTQISLEMTTS